MNMAQPMFRIVNSALPATTAVTIVTPMVVSNTNPASFASARARRAA